MTIPNYREIELELAASRALTDLSEAHGTLTGALVAAGTISLQDWFREIFPEGAAGEAETPLLALYEWTRHVLENGQLDFQLMLPEDERAMSERAAALGQWCQGFLYGLGSSPIPEIDALPAEVGEIVRDLGAMTQIGVDDDQSLEDNEQAYAELVEFVRVGVQLLFDELAAFRRSRSDETPDGPVSLH